MHFYGPYDAASESESGRPHVCLILASISTGTRRLEQRRFGLVDASGRDVAVKKLFCLAVQQDAKV